MATCVHCGGWIQSQEEWIDGYFVHFQSCLMCGRETYPTAEAESPPQFFGPVSVQFLKEQVMAGRVPPNQAARLARKYDICNPVTIYKWARKAGIVLSRRGSKPKGELTW